MEVKMRKLTFFLAFIMLMVFAAAPALAQDADIVDIAVADGRFTTLVAAVQAAGLVDTLNSEGPFTVFAPTDDAFAALPAGTVEGLLADIPALTDVLTYHVVSGAVMAADVVNLTSATTVQGSDIAISVRDGSVFLNDNVQVIITDIMASNGVIHVIDAVLLPPAEDMMEEVPTVNIRVAHFSPDTPAVDVFVNGAAAIESLEFPTITGWIELPAGSYNLAVAPAGAGIEAAAIGPADFNLPADAWITVAATGSLANGTLAPQVLVEDYSELAEGSARVSVFHAIEDAPAVDVWANGARAIPQLAYPGTIGNNDGLFTLDVPAGTYDFQVVPSGATAPVVIDLPGTMLEANMHYFVAAVGTLASPSAQLAVTNMAMMDEEMMAEEMPADSIVDIAVADGRFTTLVAAVQAAGLAETLAGEGSFTVFAPTDDAFAALPAGTVEGLLNDIPALTDILLYHVVDGAVPAETVVTLDSATTLQGSPVTISIVDGSVFLNDNVQVIITDIEASNGIIHVIDGVLLPQ
jgi:transforming growth factor-beta-induced protein